VGVDGIVRVVLVGHDDARDAVTPSQLAEVFENVERIEVVPQNVTIVQGDRAGEPMRGLRLDLGGVLADVLLPERSAREIGMGLTAGGVVRASASELPLPPAA
jgi:hypothetical protein